MNAFLFVFNNSEITRKIVTGRLDKMPNIANWYAFFENALCLASEDDAKSISQQIRMDFPDLHFIVAEVDPKKKGGWLPKSIWTFLNRPQPANTSTEDA